MCQCRGPGLAHQFVASSPSCLSLENKNAITHSLQAMSGSLLLECSAILRQQGFLDPSAKLLDEHQALAGQHSEVKKQAKLRLLLSQASRVP